MRQSYVLSLGMIIILVIVAPLGYLNLNKNIIVQEGTCRMCYRSFALANMLGLSIQLLWSPSS